MPSARAPSPVLNPSRRSRAGEQQRDPASTAPPASGAAPALRSALRHDRRARLRPPALRPLRHSAGTATARSGRGPPLRPSASHRHHRALRSAAPALRSAARPATRDRAFGHPLRRAPRRTTGRPDRARPRLRSASAARRHRCPATSRQQSSSRFCACSCLMDNKSKVKKDIDGGSLAPPPRKGGLKFAPKVPPKKAAKIVPKTEPAEEVKDESVDKELLVKLKTSQSMDPFARRVKTEKKEIRTQVAFGQGNSSYARSFPKPSSYSADGSAPKVPKEYAEPWDYTQSDYPVTLPLRRPYSGNPEILDEEEFGESSASRAQDGELTAAEELGLMDRSDTLQLLFFQLPASLPLPKKPESVAEPNTGCEENAEPASTSSKVTREETRPSSLPGSKLKELPGGFMGKILVYKSGKVKMKIGDALFDVSPGSNGMFVQEVVAINTREKHCCTLGEVSKRAVVTPDVDYLLDSIDKMEE